MSVTSASNAFRVSCVSILSFNFRYCPKCKEHRQASKKLDLWRLPEILVIHLKRFSYNRTFKNKLETFVDFPIEEFDLSTYTVHKSGNVSHRYTLYAISNHYGGLGGGHYTAFVQVSYASILTYVHYVYLIMYFNRGMWNQYLLFSHICILSCVYFRQKNLSEFWASDF